MQITTAAFRRLARRAVRPAVLRLVMAFPTKIAGKFCYIRDPGALPQDHAFRAFGACAALNHPVPGMDQLALAFPQLD
jgi:hypothetical protein